MNNIYFKQISIKNSGFVHCKSEFYTAHITLNSYDVYNFIRGTNRLIEDIDSGSWAIGYLLSMYDVIDESTLFEPLIAMVDGEEVQLQQLKHLACYMDRSYPLFSSKSTVREIVTRGINMYGIHNSADDIREMFLIHKNRFEKPLASVGNEIFKAMAAIGYSFEKQIYCFPWMSRKLFESFHLNIVHAIDILTQQNKIVILPLGK